VEDLLPTMMAKGQDLQPFNKSTGSVNNLHHSLSNQEETVDHFRKGAKYTGFLEKLPLQ
jgi:hypothetical protein